ncbi:LOW QUALITY PROTEIN: hypothetical protein TorRG33x02_140130 [Trema orientale]|uniref:Uncharacterized protein n=1 Tax=Trema orientale TaxID=63057 RepID=A0A2P5EXB7_TREOI|nr:LOW QUALITY PROTEIN: hypothetical protein TorRG33x02_140130 [Trema orientale]
MKNTLPQCSKHNVHNCLSFKPVSHTLTQPQPENSFTTIITILKSMRGNLKNWQACISPMICPFSVFLLPPWSSNKVHPLGARNLSSFRIAKAFANSRRPSRKVQKPIF